MVNEEPLTAESAKALADSVIERTKIPKKIPAINDIAGQTKVLIGALSSATLTASETPITIAPPMIADLAAQLVAYGVRQTEHIDPDAVYAPSWITDGIRQQAVKLPDQPKPTEAPPIVERTAQAPARPKRIAKTARAVRR